MCGNFWVPCFELTQLRDRFQHSWEILLSALRQIIKFVRHRASRYIVFSLDLYNKIVLLLVGNLCDGQYQTLVVGFQLFLAFLQACSRSAKTERMLSVFRISCLAVWRVIYSISEVEWALHCLCQAFCSDPQGREDIPKAEGCLRKLLLNYNQQGSITKIHPGLGLDRTAWRY